MLPLREYLATRRTEVQAQIKSLRAELADIAAAEKALTPTVEAAPAAQGGGTALAATLVANAQAGERSQHSGRMTLKELALDALADLPAGADAHGILAKIKDKHGIEIARESMSPQLSRLQWVNKVKRQGMTWRLVPLEEQGEPNGSASKDETPDVSPSGASERKATNAWWSSAESPPPSPSPDE